MTYFDNDMPYFHRGPLPQDNTQPIQPGPPTNKQQQEGNKTMNITTNPANENTTTSSNSSDRKIILGALCGAVFVLMSLFVNGSLNRYFDINEKDITIEASTKQSELCNESYQVGVSAGVTNFDWDGCNDAAGPVGDGN